MYMLTTQYSPDTVQHSQTSSRFKADAICSPADLSNDTRFSSLMACGIGLCASPNPRDCMTASSSQQVSIAQ